MSTLLHFYKTVSAHLFRAQERSTIAEEAWARVALDAKVEVAPADSDAVSGLDHTRKQAIDLIRDANLPSTLAEKAVAALDHAYYSAIAQIRQPDAASNA